MIDAVKNYVMGLLVLALLASGAYSTLLRGDIKDLKKDLEDANTSIGERDTALAIARKDAADTGKLVEAFSASFKELQDKEKARVEAVEKALEEVRLLSDSHISKATKLLSATPTSSNMCNEADDLINSYLGRKEGVK